MHKPALYHASLSEIKGEHILPALQKTFVFREFNDDPIEQAKHQGLFVFATSDPDMAQVYALKNKYMSHIGRIQIPPQYIKDKRTHLIVAIATEKEKFLDEAILNKTNIYTLPSENDFVPVFHRDGRDSGEWVTTKHISLNECQCKETGSLTEAMEHGVQIFFVKDGISKEAWEKLSVPAMEQLEKMANEMGGGDPEKSCEAQFNLGLQVMKALVNQGILIHENARRNIRPLNLNTGLIEKGSYMHYSRAYSPLQQQGIERITRKFTKLQNNHLTL